MIAFMPLYALLLQCVVNVIGAFLFAKEYKLKISHIQCVRNDCHIFAVSVPVIDQLSTWSSSVSLRKQNNWEKTDHVGAHRAPGSGVAENAQIATVPLVQSR